MNEIITVENEVWKDIKGYEGLYKVSNYGEIKSLAKKYKTWNGYKSQPEMFLKPISYNRNKCNSYTKVNLLKDKRLRQCSIHRLVALHFIDNPNNLPQVNHLDGKKWNNCFLNLKWCTGSENMRHAIDTNLYQVAKGEQLSKLKEIDVHEIRRIFKQKQLNRDEIGKLFNISGRHVSDIVSGHSRTWKWLKTI